MDVGATRNGRVAPVFKHRSHYTSKGRPKRPMTLAEAERFCDAYNAGMTGLEYRTGQLRPYQCQVCDHWHTGHFRGELHTLAHSD
jgi:hypothetical protein